MAVPGVARGALRHTYDAVIIGGGLQGLALAYELARRGMRDVCVLEASYPGAGASGRNGEMIRSAFSSPEWGTLFDISLRKWHRLSAELDFNVLFTPAGYLVLASDEADLDRCRLAAGRHRELGIRTQLLDARSIREAVPALNPDLASRTRSAAAESRASPSSNSLTTPSLAAIRIHRRDSLAVTSPSLGRCGDHLSPPRLPHIADSPIGVERTPTCRSCYPMHLGEPDLDSHAAFGTAATTSAQDDGLSISDGRAGAVKVGEGSRPLLGVPGGAIRWPQEEDRSTSLDHEDACVRDPQGPLGSSRVSAVLSRNDGERAPVDRRRL